jgi:glycosyltransferase involved in cell wall biosynthesis
MAKRVCFFAKVPDPAMLSRVEFYAQDLRILRELGYDVHIATSVQALRPADLYFVWWWTWAFFPVLLAKTLRRPVLITGVFDPWLFPKRPPLQRALMRFALAHASASVFVSQLERQQVLAMLPVRNPYYSPLVVDTDLYRPGGVPRDNFVLSIGWMHGPNAQRKCLPEIVQAAAEVCRVTPCVRFVLAGERGSYYPRLRQMADDLGVADRIDFPGTISLETKIALLQRCSVYLQPSRYEGFGLAVLEAMSCGAPVVTSSVGAVPEVVGDAALLVDGTLPSAIAAGVLELLGDPTRREAMGHAGRARAEALFPYARRKRELGEILASLSATVRP